MGYFKLCKGRVSIPHQLYFVTATAERRAPWFADLIVARLVVREMRALHVCGAVNSMAWVLMPDHLHWLIQLGRDATLSNVMRKLKGRSTRAIHRAKGVSGKIWQRGYYDHALRHEEDLPTVARFIVANPLRAGLVSDIRVYPLWDAKWLEWIQTVSDIGRVNPAPQEWR